MISKKLLAIVTVTYNAGDSVKSTINSLLAQEDVEWERIELLFIDGLSKDQTVSVINEYKIKLREKGAEVKVVSEPDNGIYDAMNKGISLATGNWIYMLNAGDLLYDKYVLGKLLLEINRSNADIIYGDYCRVNEYTSEIIKTKPLEYIEKEMIFCHQAVLVRNDLLQKKPYNLKLKFTADYEWLLSAYLNNATFKYIPLCIVKYDLSGLSAVKMIDVYKEIHKVRIQYDLVTHRFSDCCIYYVGLLKRWILSVMPQKFRWNIYSILKR